MQLRLSEGGSRCAGRVEVFYRGTWGTVCDDSWDSSDGNVVCRQLNCGNALDSALPDSIGPGSGTIWLDDVKCSGEEAFLWKCPAKAWGENDCDHEEDVKVLCSGHHGLRLAGGVDSCSGRVEVLHGELWGTLCDVYFGLEEASVVCEALHCGVLKELPQRAHFAEGNGPVWKEKYRCRGNESQLWDCPVSSWDQFRCSHENDVSVICTAASWSLRLTNGGRRCDGRVEIYHTGSWGRVQDRSWDLNDAKVVCRQLSCGVAIAAYNASKYGEAEGPVWVKDVHCAGNESHLWNCSPLRLNSSQNDRIGVGVLCSAVTFQHYFLTEHEELRLSDGGSRCAGRVEIYHNGAWGSVCDDSWDLIDADVVCKQLGCGNALQLGHPALGGPDYSPIWLDELDCSGNESFLWECPHASWGNHDCNHKEDVIIMCSEHKDIRLVNGKHRCEGRVEVFYNGTWGTVCREKLDRHDGIVICKQLECGTLDYIEYDVWTFGEGSGPIWLDEVECISHESTLWQCQSDPWGQHNCDHLEDAGVVCTEPNVMEEVPQNSADFIRELDSGQSLHLVGGNTNCSGRVEIMFNKRWGTVCDDSWDLVDANVVCRQLGCGSALLAPGGAAFGQGNGTIWLDDVKCTGSESVLFDCPCSSLSPHDCNHKEDASVVCSGLEILQATQSTNSEQQDKRSYILLATCITLGVLLIVEFTAIIMLLKTKWRRKDDAMDSWDSPIGLYQAIYEEIEIIPPVSASTESLDQIEYYTSHMSAMDPEGKPLNIQEYNDRAPADSHFLDQFNTFKTNEVSCETFSTSETPPQMSIGNPSENLTTSTSDQ
ncbi:scavenger receptor cysteine-rich domain-containing protein DMBT1-like [Mustelus asterias]